HAATLGIDHGVRPTDGRGVFPDLAGIAGLTGADVDEAVQRSRTRQAVGAATTGVRAPLEAAARAHRREFLVPCDLARVRVLLARIEDQEGAAVIASGRALVRDVQTPAEEFVIHQLVVRSA